MLAADHPRRRLRDFGLLADPFAGCPMNSLRPISRSITTIRRSRQENERRRQHRRDEAWVDIVLDIENMRTGSVVVECEAMTTVIVLRRTT